jgi:predicted  nucleic acid-binding Zn-ribbon protein
VTAKLSREALMLFERIAHGRKGVAVAEARDGLCTVCHVRLRPQIFNEVRRNDGLHQCDSCTRILYYVPSAAPGTAPQPS